jgi:hypothetical protein
VQIDIKGRPPTGGPSRKFATLRYSEQDRAWFTTGTVPTITERGLGGAIAHVIRDMKAKGWT